MNIYLAPIVQYEDTFLIVGGMQGSNELETWLDTIYEYDVGQQDGGWILRDEHLEQGRADFGVVLVDDEIAPCGGIPN